MGKRLYRSRTDRMISGVCGGLGRYFDIDPVLIRVIFVLSIFFGGIGILAYIILAIVVPTENSTYTEPTETIKENVQEMRETAETIGNDIKTTFSPGRAERGNPEEHRHYRTHRSGTVIGLIILVIGILLLLGTVTPFRWWWFGWAVFWPIVLIIIGIIIIISRRR